MKILDLVDKINVFARLEIVIGALWHRRAPHEIRVSRTGAHSGYDAEAILKKRGVRAWGGRAVSDWFVLYVSQQQAKWAESILLTAGCTLDKVMPGAKPMGKLPTPWSEQPRRKPVMAMEARRKREQTRKLSTWDRIKAAIE